MTSQINVFAVDSSNSLSLILERFKTSPQREEERGEKGCVCIELEDFFTLEVFLATCFS